MTNVIPFPSNPKRKSDMSVLIWQSAGRFHVTIFDWGHERETQTFETYDEANDKAASWLLLGATIEERLDGEGGAA